MRQLAFAARIAKRLCGIGIAEAFPLSKSKKAAEGSQLSSNGCFRVLSLMQCGDVGSQILWCQFTRRGNAAKGILKILDQDFEVLAVGLDRKFRRITFDVQIAQKSFSRLLHVSYQVGSSPIKSSNWSYST